MKKLLPEVCTIQYGFPFDSAKFSDNDGMPLIRIRDVVRGYSETYTTEEYKSEYIVHENDLLIGMDGEFNIAKWGKTPALLNQRVCRLAPKDNIDKDYLFYFMPIALKRIEEKTPFVTVKHLSAKELNKIEIPVLPLEEQRKIAETLSKVDELIAFRDQQLAKLDELVKARFVEMFGKASLLAQNQTKRLEECCISISGGNTPSMQHPEYYGGNIPFVKSGDVKGDYIVESTLTLTKTALTETTAKILPKSTLIVVIRSAALLKEFRIGMLMVDAVINQDLKALQVSEDFLPVYLMWAIKMQHQVLLNKVQTMLTSHIRMEDLLNLKIGTPPLSLQDQFAAFVERVDQQKQIVQRSLEKLELMKKALMQEYFG